jgi:hypothetical protein
MACASHLTLLHFLFLFFSPYSKRISPFSEKTIKKYFRFSSIQSIEKIKVNLCVGLGQYVAEKIKHTTSRQRWEKASV